MRVRQIFCAFALLETGFGWVPDIHSDLSVSCWIGGLGFVSLLVNPVVLDSCNAVSSGWGRKVNSRHFTPCPERSRGFGSSVATKRTRSRRLLLWVLHRQNFEGLLLSNTQHRRRFSACC